jgi:hypothetical protein
MREGAKEKRGWRGGRMREGAKEKRGWRGGREGVMRAA